MDSDVAEPLNIGSDELVTINQLVDIVEEIAGVKLERRYKLDAPQGRPRPQQRQHADPRATRLGAVDRRCETAWRRRTAGSTTRWQGT